MSIGERIEALIKAKGFRSINAFAKAAGISQGLLSDIKNGKVTSSRGTTLQKIAEALGVTVDDLIQTEEPDPTPESLTWFWRSRFAQMSLSQLEEFRQDSVGGRERALWCVRQLVGAFSQRSTAELLSQPESHINNLLQGVDAVSPDLLNKLEQRASVPVNFLRHGDPGPLDELLRKLLQHRYSGAYLQLLNRAMDQRVSPDLLERHLDLILAARGE